MRKCGHCGATVVGGGITDREIVYCSDDCYRVESLKELNEQLPQDSFDARVAAVRYGKCPSCGGRGPLDIHTAHRVMSALIITHFSSEAELSCRACARKRQALGILLSGTLGWWGIPTGFIMTPIQIGRNLFAMIRPVGRKGPSRNLRWLVAQQLRSEMVQVARLAEQRRREDAGDEEGWRR